jgi:hypothetical protein
LALGIVTGMLTLASRKPQKPALAVERQAA